MDSSREPRLRRARTSGPIGVFDSGVGGLTVMAELVDSLPNEDFLFLGDQARCPYGPRDLGEVESFVLQICRYLESRGCKMVVIACNTGTAAGLSAAQKSFSIPIIGVIQAGARAAVQMTSNGRVGVIATNGTISSGAYDDAIHMLDAGVSVHSSPAQDFVNLAERRAMSNEYSLNEAEVEYAHSVLDPLKAKGIDTLVLGCTHFPVIQDLISEIVGDDVRLVSSAKETAKDALEMLARKRAFANATGDSHSCEYLTTGDDPESFRKFGEYVIGEEITDVSHVRLQEEA